MNKDLDIQDLLDVMQSFEKKIKSDFSSNSLISDLQKIYDSIRRQNLTKEQAAKIQSWLHLLRQLLDDKDQELKEESNKLLKTDAQLKSYIRNSYLK